VLNRPLDKQHSLTCNFNKCSYSLVVVPHAVEVKRSQAVCPACQSFKLRVVSSDQIFPLNRVDSVEACVFCDDRYKHFVAEPFKGRLEPSEPSRGPGGRSSGGFEAQGWSADPARRKELKRRVNTGVKTRKRDAQLAFEAAGPGPGSRAFEEFPGGRAAAFAKGGREGFETGSEGFSSGRN